MNKKVLIALTITLLSFPVCAQTTGTFMPKHWQEALEERMNYATFEHAMGSLEKPLLLTIPVTKQFFSKNDMANFINYANTAEFRKLDKTETYPSTAGCKAFVLDEHWVIAGGTCLWNGRHTIEFTDKSGKFATGLVEPDATRKNVKIDGHSIALDNNLFVQPHETKVPHVILVRVPASSGLYKQLQRWPKVNILAFDKSSPTTLKNGTFYINTARFGLNTVRKRSLSSKTKSTSIVLQDKKGELSGVSTDPLMYLQKGKLYWIGVNEGITNLRYNNLLGDWDGEISNSYFSFNTQDMTFIKDTISKVDPTAWERIVKRNGIEIW